jgi:hypothetical protein
VSFSPLTEDALDHERLAQMVSVHVASLPLGSVVALHGSWGSGKTDVLQRVREQWSVADTGGEPLWLNPWKYGTPDLITPVVLELLSRMDAPANARLRGVAEMLIRAGSAMAFKAATVVVPFGKILDAAHEPVDDYLKGLFALGQPASAAPGMDPIAEVGDRFKALVDEYNRAAPGMSGTLLVCVDDLDRCLPDHQIAMLEAIHFLTASGAGCRFVIALDPALVRQAAETHYRTSGFDSNRYLDKLFDLRISLPALRPTKVEPLVRSVLAAQATGAIREAFGATPEHIALWFGRLFILPELTNPRLIVRVLTRMRLWADALVAAGD